jgi:predicted phosphodiesterase
MNIQLASDIHSEFHRDKGAEFWKNFKPVAEVLVLAGDICSARFVDQPRFIFEEVSKKFQHVVYVPGNHEAYATSIKQSWHNIQSAASGFSNIHALNNESVLLRGVQFFGGTGWFPRRSSSDRFQPYMNDFRLISDIKDVYESNARFRDGVEVCLPDVVVSHHLPEEECVSPRYKGDPLNAFFVSDFDVKASGAGLWLHGHTHDQVDMKIGNCRVVANPLGYPSEVRNQNAFQEALVLTI